MPRVTLPEPATVTFLEFVGEKLMGPPTRTKGNGESFWPCPVCDHDSFHSLPLSETYKHRFKCFRCSNLLWDEYDLRLSFFPTETWPVRLEVIDNWRKEWEAGMRPTLSLTDSHGNLSMKAELVVNRRCADRGGHASSFPRYADSSSHNCFDCELVDHWRRVADKLAQRSRTKDAEIAELRAILAEFRAAVGP